MLFPHLAEVQEKISVLGAVNLEKDSVLIVDFDPILLIKVNPSEIFRFYVKKSVNTWLKETIVDKEALLAGSQATKIFKARVGGYTSSIEVSSQGNVKLKAGSTFKSGQTAYNKTPPRGSSIDFNWSKAKNVVKSLFSNQLVSREKNGIYRLKVDVDCQSFEVATLVISGMDPGVSADIWKEHGFDTLG